MRLPLSCVLTHNLSIIHPENVPTFIVTFAVDKCQPGCSEGAVVAAALPPQTSGAMTGNPNAAARIQSLNMYIFKKVSEYKCYSERQQSSSHYFESGKAGTDKFLWIPKTLTLRLFQPLCAVEITLTFLDTIFRGFWRQLSIASVIDSLAEEMWWKMTRLLDTEWEHNGVAKKGLADTTSENAN